MRVFSRFPAPIILFKFAFFTATVGAAPGFLSTHDPSLPAKVREAAKSVFWIAVAAEPSHFLPEHQVEMQKNYLETTETNPLTRAWRLAELSNRVKTPAGKMVPIHHFSPSTGFLFKDHRTIALSKHALIDSRALQIPSDTIEKWEDAKRLLKRQRFRMLIMDSNYRVIFSTVADADLKASLQYQFAFYGHPTVTSLLGSPFNEMSLSTKTYLLDFVAIRFNKPFEGVPLDLCPSPAGVGQAVYAPCFPMATEGRQRDHGVPDSDGQSQRVSVGSLTAVPARYREFVTSRENERADPYLDSRIYFDLDVVPSTSGSPVLDEEGAIVGNELINFQLDARQILTRYQVEGGHGICAEFLRQIWNLRSLDNL